MLLTSFKGKKLSIGILALIFLISGFFVSSEFTSDLINQRKAAKKVSKMDRIDLAIEQEFEMTKDPKLGIVPRKRLFSAKKSLKSLKTSRTGIPDISWEERGPTNIGGRTRSILVDANDPTGNTLFAGSVSGGLWKCTNALSGNPSWNKVDDFFESLAIGAIAQDPINHNVIYFGTGEGYFNEDAITGLGIWKSNDGGSSFSYMESTDNSFFDYIQSIVINDSGDVYVATRNGGVQKSSNGGENWTKVLGIEQGALNDRVADLEISANGHLYAAVGIFQTDGIYKSIDGSTWDLINNGLPGSGYERIELACAPSNNEVAYALLQDEFSGECMGIYKTTDGGSNWIEKTNPSAIGMSNFARNQAWYNLSSAVDPNDETNLIIGGIDLLKSSNSGDSWTQISQWYGGNGIQYVHADQHAIVFHDSNIIIFGNDGGVFATSSGSDDLPIISSLNDGYNVTQLYSGSMHPSLGENYYLAGAQDNGTQKFENEGLNNTSEVTGGDGGICHIDQNNPNVQITSNVYNNYRVSTNGGSSFSNRNFNNLGRFINPFDYDDSEKKLYGAYKADKYFRWNNPASAGSDSEIVTVSGFAGGVVSHVYISPNIENRVYFGTGSGELVYVDDANSGTNKTGIVIRSGGGYISSISIENGNEEHILLTLSNYGVTSIFETVNGGTSWQDVEGNLPDMPIRDVLFNPNDNDQAIIATELGVWTTDNLNGSSTSWDPSNSGLANVRVDMLKIRESDSEIIAATHGRGLFSTDHFSIVTASFDVPSSTSNEFSLSGDMGPCNLNFKQLTVPVHLNKDPNSNVTVNLSIEGSGTATANEDFTLITTNLLFLPGGSQTQNVIINVLDDVLEEDNENFIINLAVSGGEPGEFSSYTHTIVDDDKDPLNSPDENEFNIGTDTELLANAPFKGFYEDERSQIIIKSSELNNAGLFPGEFSKLALEIQFQESNQAYQNFNIKMKHTNLNEFLSGTQAFESGMTNVYSGIFNPQVGWNEFELTTPFSWNGVDNVIVEICFNNSSWTADDIVYASESGFNSVLYKFLDGAEGCNIANGSQILTKRPNIKITQPLVIDVSNNVSNRKGELEIGGVAHFYDEIGKLIMSIENTGSNSIGCLDVNVDNYGLGQESPLWLSGYSHTTKTFYVDADNNSDYDITLYYSEAELAVWSDINDLGIVKTDGPIMDNTSELFEYIENQDLTITSFGNENHYGIKASFSGFSGFALSDFVQGVVPLDLLSLDASNEGTYNLISWITENEKNLDRFEIERSVDGIDFTVIAILDAKGDGNYQIKDNELLKSYNSYYYRLRMYDFNGQFKLSDQVVVDLKNPNTYTDIFPNPFNSEISISSKEFFIQEVEVYDFQGKRIKSIKINKADIGDFNINLSSLSNNIYMVKIISLDKIGLPVIEYKKIIKSSD